MEFTETDKIIAKQIRYRYKWLSRSSNGALFLTIGKPVFEPTTETAVYFPIQDAFNALDNGQSIKIEYIIHPQILTDDEYDYLNSAIRPSHYKIMPNVEVMDVISAILDRTDYTPSECFMLGNVIKYVLRADQKSGTEACRKAVTYLKALIGSREKVE